MKQSRRKKIITNWKQTIQRRREKELKHLLKDTPLSVTVTRTKKLVLGWLLLEALKYPDKIIFSVTMDGYIAIRRVKEKEQGYKLSYSPNHHNAVVSIPAIIFKIYRGKIVLGKKYFCEVQKQGNRNHKIVVYV